MLKSCSLRNVAAAVLTAVFALSGGEGVKAATDIQVATVGGNVSARSFNFAGDVAGFGLTTTAYDLRVTNAAPSSIFGIFDLSGTDPNSGGDPFLRVNALRGGVDNTCDGTGGCGPANTLNTHPSHMLGLDGSQAQNFIGYGEAVQIAVTNTTGNGEDFIGAINSITIYEKKSEADKNYYIFDSSFQYRATVTIQADAGNASGATRVCAVDSGAANFDPTCTWDFEGNSNADYGTHFFLVGGPESGNANDAFTIAAIAFTAEVPLPASVWMLLGGFGLLGWVGHRRRRAA